MRVEANLKELGLELPGVAKTPPGVVLPFSWVRVRGNRAYVSGHGPQNPDGTMAGWGKVGAEVSLEEGYRAARVTAWLRVFGMVNAAPGFRQMPGVINGFSDLILEVYGPEVGQHARSAVGMAELPFGIPVEVEAEVEIDP